MLEEEADELFHEVILLPQNGTNFIRILLLTEKHLAKTTFRDINYYSALIKSRLKEMNGRSTYWLQLIVQLQLYVLTV